LQPSSVTSKQLQRRQVDVAQTSKVPPLRQ
jgi:hypothetical protein